MTAIRRRSGLIICAMSVCISLVGSGEASSSDLDELERTVRAKGIQARIDPEERDRLIGEIAATLQALGQEDEKGLRSIQFTPVFACSRCQAL